jgi:hypothetical protein
MRASDIKRIPISIDKVDRDLCVSNSYNVGTLFRDKLGVVYSVVAKNDNGIVVSSSTIPQKIYSYEKEPFEISNISFTDGSTWNDEYMYVDGSWKKTVVDGIGNTYDVTKLYKVGDIVHCTKDKNNYKCYNNDENNAIWGKISDTEPQEGTKCSESLSGYIYFNDNIYKCLEDNVWLNLQTNTIKMSNIPNRLESAKIGTKIIDTDDSKLYLVGSSHDVIAVNTDRDPSKTDDVTKGYTVGFEWTNTNNGNKFKLYNAEEDNAIWAKVIKHKPTTKDDDTAGYNVDDFVFNEADGNFYKCIFNTTNAAKWDDVTDEFLKYNNIKKTDSKPITTDDITKGFYAGDIAEAQDTKKLYKALSTQENAAIWAQMEGREPTPIDDANDGWDINEYWYSASTDKYFKCVDNTVSNAVWEEVSGSVSGSSDRQIFYIQNDFSAPRNCILQCDTSGSILPTDSVAFTISLDNTYYTNDHITVMDAENNAQDRPIKIISNDGINGDTESVLDVNGFIVELYYRNGSWISVGE